MPKVFVYDSFENRMMTYNLNESDSMPFSTGTTLRVREFRGSSSSPTLWTTTAAMEAWNLTRRSYGKGIHVGYAFKRIWEGTTPAWPSTWARARAPPPATPSGRRPRTPAPGAMWSLRA